MKLMALALSAAVGSSASAAFVGFVVSKTQTSNSGIALDVYTLWARFDGPTDSVLNAFNLDRTIGSGSTNIFYHKDLSSSNSGTLTKSFGTWNPVRTGSSTENRPFDSYVTLGGIAGLTNTTQADWWDRPDIPLGGGVGWFNGSPPNNQGRVGSPGNTATDVRLGQFVLDRDANGGVWTLQIGYNSGAVGAPPVFATSTFSLPAPGAIALLGLAGLARRRRR